MVIHPGTMHRTSVRCWRLPYHLLGELLLFRGCTRTVLCVVKSWLNGHGRGAVPKAVAAVIVVLVAVALVLVLVLVVKVFLVCNGSRRLRLRLRLRGRPVTVKKVQMRVLHRSLLVASVVPRCFAGRSQS